MFDEVSFPVLLSYGSSASPRQSVTIIEKKSGHERRNINQVNPRLVYSCQISPRMPADLEAVLEFYRARDATARGFRFLDPTDFRSAAYGVAITPTDQPVETLTATTFQLVKRYTSGAVNKDRRIRKPRASTVRVADNGTEVFSPATFTLDDTTGVLTFGAPPTGPVTWGGEFDVPVRFDSELPQDIEGFENRGTSFRLREVPA